MIDTTDSLRPHLVGILIHPFILLSEHKCSNVELSYGIFHIHIRVPDCGKIPEGMFRRRKWRLRRNKRSQRVGLDLETTRPHITAQSKGASVTVKEVI